METCKRTPDLIFTALTSLQPLPVHIRPRRFNTAVHHSSDNCWGINTVKWMSSTQLTSMISSRHHRLLTPPLLSLRPIFVYSSTASKFGHSISNLKFTSTFSLTTTISLNSSPSAPIPFQDRNSSPQTFQIFSALFPTVQSMSRFATQLMR